MDIIIDALHSLFDDIYGKEILIQHMNRTTTFEATLEPVGVYIKKLGKNDSGLIKFEVFKEVLTFLEQQTDFKAKKGNAQGKDFKLNQCTDFTVDSVEGYIANKCFGVQEGETGTRRVTYYGAILKACGLIVDDKNYIRLVNRVR